MMRAEKQTHLEYTLVGVCPSMSPGSPVILGTCDGIVPPLRSLVLENPVLIT